MTFMKPKELSGIRVSLAQINATVGDLKGNREKIRKSLEEAKRAGSHLAVFPELALTGYPPEDLLFQEYFISENLRSLRAVLPHTDRIIAIMGFVDRDRSGRLFNAAAVLGDRKLIHVYHKVELPNYGVFDERRYFTPGSGVSVVDFGGLRLGLSICEDIWQKNSSLYRNQYRQAVSVHVNISASPFHAGKQEERIALLKRLASRLKAPVIYQNLVGGQDELVFDGGSMALDRGGKLLAEAHRFEAQSLVVDIPVRLFPAKRRSPVKFVSARVHRTWSAPPVSVIPRPAPSPLGYEEEVYKALVLGTRDYLQKNSFKYALIGLSGGIDSAIVARIAVDALGADNVIGVTMPSLYTSGETLSDAKLLARNLHIRCLELRIDGILKSYLEITEEVLNEKPGGTVEENLQARIRGNLLMALSNHYGHLVLTTGNKSEMATGYCTLYGDMAGGFAVIKDVPKTLVFRLARYRNGLKPKDSIPDSILKRPPTAELRPNQTDQDTLPAYELLDKFLEFYVEKDMDLSRIVARGVPRQTAERSKRMVDGNEYKRRQAPPGIKITPKAFGRDRRMPITNRFPG